MHKRYIEKLGMTLSPLGFGVMRLPMNQDGVTFPETVYNLIAEAYERGVNYFDTAYLYQWGRSEGFIREALVDKYPRDSFRIADKLPVWECGGRDDMERIFNTQLERLGVEYIDFYLLHALYRSRWLDIRGKGVLDFLDEKRREGKIRKAGFSFHDTADELPPILDAYNWDFVQLQINYYDWTTEHAKASYNAAASRGIPCMVMEPVGGGRLASLPDNAEKPLKDLRPDDSAASWAVRFVAGLPNVAVTLSGMSNMEQLTDNLSVFDNLAPFTEEESAAVKNVVEILRACNTIPCGACGYCLDECPKNVDIPQIFKRYNDYMQFDNMRPFDIDYFMYLPEQRRAVNCVSCGKCAKHCPQNIDVPAMLKKVRMALERSVGVSMAGLEEALTEGTRLICFGAGYMGHRALSVLSEFGYKADYFCDNSEKLWGTNVNGVEVISPARLSEMGPVCVLITSGFYGPIKAQLEKMGIERVLPEKH